MRSAILLGCAILLADAVSLHSQNLESPEIENCRADSGESCLKLGIEAAQSKEGQGTARYYFGLACELEIASGCMNLGYQWIRGLGGPLDFQQGSVLSLKGCELGDQRACFNAAQLIFEEKIVGSKRDMVSLWEKACRLGHINACNNVGLSYESGFGVVKDEEKSKLFLRKACNGGVSDACR